MDSGVLVVVRESVVFAVVVERVLAIVGDFVFAVVGEFVTLAVDELDSFVEPAVAREFGELAVFERFIGLADVPSAG